MSTGVGRAAEEVAAQFLQSKGYKVLARNWRTRWCEIDIVAQQASIVYLVEVKYRARSTWGAGLDYITPRKMQQMHFAAEFWQAQHKWRDDCRLAAIELTGTPPEVVNWLDEV